MISGDIQWGRHAEVSFTNFNSGLVSTIKSNVIDNNNVVVGDGLRISFEYSKSDDQGYDSPNGKIVIYGLTEKTFNALGDRLRAEVEVKAGYLKSKKNSPNRIFYAVLMDKKWEIQDGVSVSTFEVLGDFIEKVVAYKMSLNLPKPTLIEIMVSIAEAMNKGFGLRLDGTEEQQAMLAEYFNLWKVSPYGYAFAGTPAQELKRIKEAWGIVYRIEKDMIVFSIADSWFNWHLDGAMQISALEKNKANTTLVAENKTAPEVKDLKPIDSKGNKINLVKTHALVLRTDTGLIGSPTLHTDDATKNYDSALADGEEIKSKKEQTVVRDKKTGEVKKDKDGKVKMTKKPKTYKITRRTVTVRAYINSMIDFNSQIILITDSGICDGTYRVRSVKFVGDTDGTDWYMELKLNE